MTSRLLVATSNAGKVREIAALLAPRGIEVLSLKDVDIDLEVVEDQDSFRGNAVKKATEWAAASGLATLADDSGLEVDALDGAPGIYSARFGGAGLDDSGRNRHLLDQLSHVASPQRTARFRCVLAWVGQADAEPTTFDGTLEGRIAREIQGEHGFGYDPLFIPNDHDETLARLGPEIKNRISHRARALAAFVEWYRG